MTQPWSKLPRALRGDLRYTLLSPEAVSAFVSVWLAADDNGYYFTPGATRALDLVTRELSLRRPGAPSQWAADALNECLDAGLLESLDGGDTLRVIDWVDAPTVSTMPREESPAPREPIATASAPTDPSATPAAPSRGRGRPRKGDAPMSSTERGQMLRFNRREGRYKDAPLEMTWAQWKAEQRGDESADERNETLADETKTGNENPADRNENTKRKSNETETKTRAVSGTSVLSETSEREDAEKTKKEDETKTARVGRNETQRNETRGGGNETKLIPTDGGKQSSLLDLGAPTRGKPATSTALPFSVREALETLASTSEGRFVPGEKRDVGQGLTIRIQAQVKAYPTTGEWSVMGEWLAAGAMPSLGIIGPAWVASANFGSAMAQAREWDRMGRPAIGQRAPAEPPKPAVSQEETEWQQKRREWDEKVKAKQQEQRTAV